MPLPRTKTAPGRQVIFRKPYAEVSMNLLIDSERGGWHQGRRTTFVKLLWTPVDAERLS